MAKRQTRKSVSLSSEAYTALSVLATTRECSVSSLVEDWVRRETGLPPRPTAWSENKPVKAVRTVRIKDVLPDCVLHAQRIQEAKARRANEQFQELDQRREIAIENPCRDERCRLVYLHEAHERKELT